MSQRKLSSVETRGGGLGKVKEIAARKKVHLVLLRDDKGDELLAASRHKFTVIC